MAELKTKLNDASVDEFLYRTTEGERLNDCLTIRDLMQQITGEPAKMWGPSIVGFGTYHYKYKSGREGDWMLIGFSPRKNALTLYVMDGYSDYQNELEHLGKFTKGKGCLYIKRLADIDLKLLQQIIEKSINKIKSGALTL